MARRRDDSQFVYPRSAVRDLAACLASTRAETWCDEQRLTLDRLIDNIADTFGEHDPTFDADTFGRLSRYQHDRLMIHTQGELPWPTTPSPSSGT